MPGFFSGSLCITVSNFLEIGHTIAKKESFVNFSKWRPSATLFLSCGFGRCTKTMNNLMVFVIFQYLVNRPQ